MEKSQYCTRPLIYSWRQSTDGKEFITIVYSHSTILNKFISPQHTLITGEVHRRAKSSMPQTVTQMYINALTWRRAQSCWPVFQQSGTLVSTTWPVQWAVGQALSWPGNGTASWDCQASWNGLHILGSWWWRWPYQGVRVLACPRAPPRSERLPERKMTCEVQWQLHVCHGSCSTLVQAMVCCP